MVALIVHQDPFHCQAMADLFARLQPRGIVRTESPARMLAALKDPRAGILWVFVESGSPHLAEIENILATHGHHHDTCLIQLHQGSRLTRPRLAASRTDAICQAPAGLSKLRQALAEAYAHRMRARDTLLCLGIPEAGLGTGHWTRMHHAQGEGELKAFLMDCHSETGAVILSPDRVSGQLVGWMRRFKKNLEGRKIILVCAERSPERVGSLRTFCRSFISLAEAGDDARPRVWRRLLRDLSTQLLTNWQVGAMTSAIRTALNRGDWKAARKLLREIRKGDRSGFEHYRWKGELQLRRGLPNAAMEQFLHARELNPCHPRPHIALISLAADASDGSLIHALTRQALSYCPQYTPLQQLIKELGFESRLSPQDDT